VVKIICQSNWYRVQIHSELNREGSELGNGSMEDLLREKNWPTVHAYQSYPGQVEKLVGDEPTTSNSFVRCA
jgi:hypothetical protein